MIMSQNYENEATTTTEASANEQMQGDKPNSINEHQPNLVESRAPLQQQQVNDPLNQRLVRHLSLPIQLKSPSFAYDRGSPANPDPNSNGSTSPQFAIKVCDSRGSSTDSRTGLRRHHRHWHSQCVRRCLQDDRQTKCHKPSSNATCDSAFSQSQTTLESEIDQSSFTRSIKRDHHHDNHHESRHDPSLKQNDLYGVPAGDSSSELSDSISHEKGHFKIIWSNLSYEVPEKRFSHQISTIKRWKNKIWPHNEDLVCSQQDRDVPVGETVSHSSSDDLPPLAYKNPTIGKPRRQIFSNLNGCVKSGQLTAILGPSGAGKTTLLKCLTNSITKGVSGDIDVIGGSAASHRLKLCIIPQKDYLFDNLTVIENLMFASRIKNTEANFEHQQNVHRVASLLGLQACLKLKTSKLSGGQYKRVSIAQELLSKPDILVLDEPTSGLDSRTCFRTVSVLRDLVNLSRAGLMPPLAIIMTIHQPQIKIFNLFHHVYIMSSSGYCVYEGRPEHLIDTVADCCKLLPPADDLNPASFIIDLASEVYGTEPIDQLTEFQRESFAMLNHGVGVIERSQNANLAKVQITMNPSKSSNFFAFEAGPKRREKKSTDNFRMSDRLKRSHKFEGNFWFHTGLLIKRLWISSWRDSLLTTTRLTFHLIIPFVFYFIYSSKSGEANACPHIEREFDLQNFTSDANIKRMETQHNELILTFENVSLFFLLLYSFSMCVLAVTALSFPLNMQILLKETSNGWYSMPRFVMAKTLADLPVELTMPMISVAMAYVLTGQPSSQFCWRMWTITAVMTLCSLISQTQGLLFGAYFMNNIQAAVFISQASSLPWIMLSGFTTRVSELPQVLRWLSFGSIYRLGLESIVAVRYGFGMCPCDEELVGDTPARMTGIPEQLKSVMQYYLDTYSDQQNDNNGNSTTGGSDIFQKIASTLSRANTYGLDIVTCHDVRPFIMSAREVDESTLPTFMSLLVFIFICLKILLFWVVKLRAG